MKRSPTSLLSLARRTAGDSLSSLHIVDGDALQFLEPKLIDALDRSIASMAPGSSRPEAIRFILQDWLTGAGFIRFNEDPEGAN